MVNVRVTGNLYEEAVAGYVSVRVLLTAGILSVQYPDNLVAKNLVSPER